MLFFLFMAVWPAYGSDVQSSSDTSLKPTVQSSSQSSNSSQSVSSTYAVAAAAFAGNLKSPLSTATPGSTSSLNVGSLTSSSLSSSSLSSSSLSSSSSSLGSTSLSSSSLSSSSPSVTTTFAVPKISLDPAATSFTDCLRTCGEDCTRTAGMEPVDVYGTYGFSSFINTNNPYYNRVASTAAMPYCYSLWTENLFEWYATEPLTRIDAPTATVASAEPTWSLAPAYECFNYSAATPCCSSCTLFGGDVEVYHWPRTATISELVDTVNDFTFMSPSIYVGFQSLYATDLCGTIDGAMYSATTLGFDPGELSTRLIYYTTSPVEYFNYTAQAWSTSAVPYTQARQYEYYWGEFGDMFSWTRGTWQSNETIICTMITTTSLYLQTTYTWSYNPCSPELQIPTQLYTLNDAWQDCTTILWGFFDPPYVLTQGGNLEAFTTSVPVALQNQAPTTPPAAGSTATPMTAAQTPAATTANPVRNPTTSIKQPAPTPADPVSVADPSVVVIGDSTTQTIATHSPPAALAGTSFLVVGSQTVFAGGNAITISGGTVVSLLPGASSVVVAGKTQPIGELLGASAGVQTTVEAEWVIASQTLIAGGAAITVSGTVMSMLPGGSSVVIGGTKTVDASALVGASKTLVTETTSEAGLGGIIASLGGYGGRSSTAASTSASSSTSSPGIDGTVQLFTGQSGMGRGDWLHWTYIWGLLFGTGVVGAGVL